jgi:hypothetical protein
MTMQRNVRETRRTIVKMSKRVVIGAVITSVAVAASSGAALAAPEADSIATDAGPSHVVAHGQIAGKVNPQVMQLTAGAYYRHVFTRDEARGEDTAYLQAGGALTVNPAYIAPQAHAEWRPARLFALRTEYETLSFTGHARGMLTFDAKDASFGESALDAATGSTGIGHKLQLSPMFHNQLGPVHIRNRTDIAYYRYVGDGPYFYELQHDTLIAKGDVILDGRTDVLVEAWRGGRDASLFLGPSYAMTRAFRTEIQRQRLGGSVTFTPSDAWGPIARPTFFAEAGVNVQDTNREGQAFAAFGVRAEMR